MKIVFILVILYTTLAYSKNTLKILMTLDNAPIYTEGAGGTILSTFNYNVRGSNLEVESDFELKSSIVKNWKWNSQKKTYLLSLDPNVKFHDGTSPNSKDLEFSILRGFFSDKASLFNVYLGSIVGTENIAPSVKYQSRKVEGVKIVDDLSIEVKLRYASPTFLFSLTRPYFSITSQRFYEEDLLTWKKYPVGTGKYRVINETEEKIVLRSAHANTKFKQIELYKKATDNVNFDISFIQNKIINEKKYLTPIPVTIMAFFLNTENDLSKDINFRNALFYLVNRDELTPLFRDANKNYEFLPTNFWSKSNTKNDYSMALAKQFADKIPKSLRQKKWKVQVFSVSNHLSENMQSLAEIMEKKFLEIGVSLKFYASSDKFLSKERARDIAFAVSSRICDNLDPLLMFGTFRSGPLHKFANAQNDKNFDKLYAEAAEASGSSERVGYMRKLSAYAIQKRFVIPILEQMGSYYFNPVTVKSLGYQPATITLDFDKIEMN